MSEDGISEAARFQESGGSSVDLAVPQGRFSFLKRRWKFRASLAFILGLLMFPQVRSWIRVQRVLWDLRSIDAVPTAGESPAGCEYRVSREAGEALDFLEEPEDLYSFLQVSHVEMRRYQRRNSSSHENPIFKAEAIAIYRLADRADERSLQYLARAAGNPGAHWDGERAFHIGSAVTDVGRPCLPHLRAVAHGPKGDFVRELIEAIERDEGW